MKSVRWAQNLRNAPNASLTSGVSAPEAGISNDPDEGQDNLTLMTPTWTLGLVIVAAGLLGALVGLVGVQRARRTKATLLRSVDEARIEERRSAAYLETALGWHAYLQTIRPLAFPDEAHATSRQRDLATVLRSRAQLELFGSGVVQALHEEALDEAVRLIDLIRSMPKTPATGEPDIAAGRFVLRFVLGEMGKRVDALERQMYRELRGPSQVAGQLLEVIGRPHAGQTGAARGRRQPNGVDDGRAVSPPSPLGANQQH